jgi:DMSO/TMAO reductase YedYZ molybdopterin-dependent catalytic subunit
MDRRTMLKNGAAGIALAGGGLLLPRFAAAAGVDVGPAMLPSGALAEATLAALPGKRPLIKKSYRPPNYETPVGLFNEAYTPNDAFFVRYHLSDIPEVDAKTWKVRIGGASAAKPTEFSLVDLQQGFERVELAAVCQCSGNRRGLSDPHVPGVEWGYGAMGNAKWAGVRLKDVLNKVGVKPDALEVALDGADGPAVAQTPDFHKSLPLWKALDENTLIAFEMNGQPLPHWNGAPARIVVPGWTATYWMKHIVSIDVIAEPLKTFWMNPAYRVPKQMFPLVQRFVSQEKEGEATTPITEMVVNSLITNLTDGQRIKAGKPVEVKGIAWDGGYGIGDVAVSLDGGASWRGANLGPDLGRFAWRQWSFHFTPPKRGQAFVSARATNRVGATQVDKLLFNGAGYHNNVVQSLALTVV